MKKRIFRRIDLRLSILLGITFIFLITIHLFIFNYRDARKSIKEGYVRELESSYEMIIGGISRLSHYIFHFYIDTPTVRQLFSRGVKSTDPLEKNEYRQQLYRHLLPMYTSSLDYGLRQLHFHEADNRSYLRIHRPDLYGDSLTDVRYSVRYVNEHHLSISGFEEGRIFNGYRFVYPLALAKQHLGSVEVSVSMGSVIGLLSERLKQKTQFLVSAEQVKRKVYEQELDNYSPWFVDDSYYVDKGVFKANIIHPSIRSKEIDQIRQALMQNRREQLSFCMLIHQDTQLFILCFMPIKNIEGEQVAYIVSLFTGSELQALEDSYRIVLFIFVLLFFLLSSFIFYYRFSQKKLERMARFDFLTKVYVRGVIMELVHREFLVYQRYGQLFSVIMIDIDHFKKINDAYGHASGDIVLAGIAGIMSRHIRAVDSIGRYGGEEFIILLPNTRKDQAVIVAEKLRMMIASHDFHELGRVSISAGVAEVSSSIGRYEDLIKHSDVNLYRAKETGRNRVVAL